VSDEAPADDAPAPDAPEAAEEAPAAPEPNPVHEEMAALLQSGGLGGDAVVRSESVFDDFVVRVVPDAWRRAAEVARDALDCDYLSFIAGIDWAPAPKEGGAEATGDTSQPAQPTEMIFGATGSNGRFQVFAHVQSTRRPTGTSGSAGRCSASCSTVTRACGTCTSPPTSRGTRCARTSRCSRGS
jgi:hypothetical protein